MDLKPGKLLSGNELFQIHLNVDRNLPKAGVKEFSPTATWMEKKQIQRILDERKGLLEEERVEKWGTLAGAVWNHKLRIAEVTRRTGKHFQTMGFEKGGKLFLYPEEALYLLETNNLELLFGGLPMSIQQGFSILLGQDNGCEMKEYRTYSHLIRQGYKVLRYSKDHLSTSYERRIRLHQHAAQKRNPIIHPADCQNSSLLSNPNSKAIEKDNNVTCRVEDPMTAFKEESEVNSQSEKNLDSIANVDTQSERSPYVANFKLESRVSIISQDEPVDDRNDTAIDRNVPIHPESEERNEGTDFNADHTQNVNEREKDLINRSHEVANSSAQKENEVYSMVQSLVDIRASFISESRDKENHSSPSSNKIRQTSTFCNQIAEMLKNHFEGSVPAETLTAVASSAAETIMSHVAKQREEDTALREDFGAKDLETELKINTSDEKSKILLDINTDESLSNDESSNPCATKTVEESCQNESVSEVLAASEETGHNVVCNNETQPSKTSSTNLVFHSSESSHLSYDDDDVMVLSDDGLIPNSLMTSLKRYYSAKDDAGTALFKKVKVADMSDSEVEILDVVTEKHVELVDISDNDSSEIEEDVPEEVVDKTGNVQVIDLDDSSSSCTSSSASSSSSSKHLSDKDSDVTVTEEKVKPKRSINSWEKNFDVEREHILRNFPCMYNACAKTIQAPPIDLLPRHVEPQHAVYTIDRRNLIMENRQNYLMSQQPQNVFHSNPTVQLARDIIERNPLFSQPWLGAQRMPMNPADLVQTIVQLVFPMLGVTPPQGQFVTPFFPPSHRPGGFPPVPQMWQPASSPWIQGQPMWPSPRPRFYPPRNQWQPRRGRPFRFPRHYRPTRDLVQVHPPTEIGQVYIDDQSWPEHQPHSSHSLRSRGRSRSLNFRQLKSSAHSLPRDEHSPRKEEPSSSPTAQMPVECQQVSVRETRGEVKAAPKRKKKWPQGQQRPKGSPRYFRPPKKKTYQHMHSLLEDARGFLNDNQVDKEGITKLIPQQSCNDEERGVKNESPSVKLEEKDHLKQDNEDVNVEELALGTGDGEIKEEESSEEAENQPLVQPQHCTDYETVMKTLQIIEYASFGCSSLTKYAHNMRLSFDVYLPTVPFKKGNPPPPSYHLCIMGVEENVPSPVDVSILQAEVNDSIPVLFAVVQADSISFFHYSEVNLPILSVCHL